MNKQQLSSRERIIQKTKNPMMIEFTGERIVQRLTEKDLMKIQKIMKKNPSLSITTFLRILRNIMSPTSEEDFYLTYGLFRLFQEICLSNKKNEISFDDISTIITQKMPSFNQQILLREKLYPHSLQIPDNIKTKIFAPEIIGKVLQERQRLQQRPYLSDKIMHINRRVQQTIYSKTNNLFFSIDYPTSQIKLLNSQFEQLRILTTQLEISKRDSIVTYMAWSQHDQRLAVLLGNYSISLWAKQDTFRYQVNVPLPLSLLSTPYVMIGYMNSSKRWYALDNHPSIYILSSYNYEPQNKFMHFKMIKEKESEKIHIAEIQYRKLLCVAFERNVFMISLEKRQLITQLSHFKTSITSIAFSQTYQALFISNFQNHFTSFELSQHQDLTLKGKFEGHKHLISIIGVLQERPVVYSLDESSLIKLWDIRDFSCYQTFHVLKNIIFRQVIALPQAICFIGSKHFCYRWQRFTQFHEKEQVILVSQIQKNILIIMNKEVRVYSHSNGVLLKVLKGIFPNAFIVYAYLIEITKMLLLINDDGQVKVYSTKDFHLLSQFSIPPKPCYLNYQKQTELLTICSMGQIRICDFKEVNNIEIKRKIHNNEQIIKYCKISTFHDIIAVQYLSDKYLFFYSYERAKPLGFLIIEDLVSLQFIQEKNIIFILCKEKLMLFTYKKFQNSITFFLKDLVYLWKEVDIQKNRIQYRQVAKNVIEISSTSFAIFQHLIVISSNNSNFICHLNFNIESMKYQQIKLNRENYNPYRIAIENHLKSFEISKPSLIIQDKQEEILKNMTYIRHHHNNQSFQLLSSINNYYCITNQRNVTFYNKHSEVKGLIDVKQTLPLSWDLHNYSQEEFHELQFVVSFIEQEKSEKIKENHFFMTVPMIMPQTLELLTLNAFTTVMSSSKKQYSSTSLREKKMVLQKQRDQKQKYENYLQMRKGEQLIKLKQNSRTGNEKYVSEALAFLNINRNKLLLSNGLPEPQLPQIRSLQIKLNASVNKDEKKSIKSKLSHPHSNMSPIVISKVKFDSTPPILKSNLLQNSQMHMLKKSTDFSSYKERIQKLNDSLKQSKFNHKIRSNSLPFLKKISEVSYQ